MFLFVVVRTANDYQTLGFYTIHTRYGQPCRTYADPVFPDLFPESIDTKDVPWLKPKKT